MATGRVYGIADANGQVRYIGKTSQRSVESRFAQHLRAVDRDDPRTRHLPLHRWLKKHRGEAGVIELEAGEWTAAELNDREIAWIAQYGLENLLNIARGGNGGWIPGNVADKPYIRTAEHRRQKSEQMKAWYARLRSEWAATAAQN
jgi:hypothetical protein